MARKKVIPEEVKKLKEAIKAGQGILGTERTLKELKRGKIKKIYLSKNCPLVVKKDILYYSQLANVEVIQINLSNEELGVLCKKPFSISVLGVR